MAVVVGDATRAGGATADVASRVAPENGREGIDDAPCVRAVEHDQAGRADPREELEDGDGHVLREATVEGPHLAVGGRPRHAVPVEVQEEPLVAAAVAAAQSEQQLLDVLGRRVKAELDACARLPCLVLRLQGAANCVEHPLRRVATHVDAGDCAHRAWRPHHIRRVDAQVQAENECCADRLEPLSHPPPLLVPSARARAATDRMVAAHKREAVRGEQRAEPCLQSVSVDVVRGRGHRNPKTSSVRIHREFLAPGQGVAGTGPRRFHGCSTSLDSPRCSTTVKWALVEQPWDSRGTAVEQGRNPRPVPRLVHTLIW